MIKRPIIDYKPVLSKLIDEFIEQPDTKRVAGYLTDELKQDILSFFLDHRNGNISSTDDIPISYSSIDNGELLCLLIENGWAFKDSEETEEAFYLFFKKLREACSILRYDTNLAFVKANNLKPKFKMWQRITVPDHSGYTSYETLTLDIRSLSPSGFYEVQEPGQEANNFHARDLEEKTWEEIDEVASISDKEKELKPYENILYIDRIPEDGDLSKYFLSLKNHQQNSIHDIIISDGSITASATYSVATQTAWVIHYMEIK